VPYGKCVSTSTIGLGIRGGEWGPSAPRCCYCPPLVDRTLVIVKPDAVERGLAGEIIRRFECKSLKLVAAELRTITSELAQAHYAEHAERPFFADLVKFFTRSPVLVLVVEGPKDTYAVVRTMMGVTNSAEAAPGTIRGDFGITTTENLVHGSDSPESAAREIALFFPGLS
jgi:nucleoside-diphosphate kinase